MGLCKNYILETRNQRYKAEEHNNSLKMWTSLCNLKIVGMKIPKLRNAKWGTDHCHGQRQNYF